jgi:hypothetical protein
MDSLVPLFDLSVKSMQSEAARASEGWMIPWRCVSGGLMEYRRGNFAAAAAWCQRCLSLGPGNAARTATAQVVLAMAQQQLSEMKSARLQLAEAREAIDDRFNREIKAGDGVEGYWFDWLLARNLLREATPLIEGSGRK